MTEHYTRFISVYVKCCVLENGVDVKYKCQNTLLEGIASHSLLRHTYILTRL